MPRPNPDLGAPNLRLDGVDVADGATLLPTDPTVLAAVLPPAPTPFA